MQRPQRGFTLVEIAIVLVVIGLLLGGVLKGQELIASSRVRNLADQQAGIQAAYYGFQDRYRSVPGDMDQTAANNAIGATINTGGDANGQLVSPSGSLDNGNSVWSELNGVWEHLSKSGFIKGNYDGTNTTSAPGSDDGPANVFNGQLILARDNQYQDTGSGTLPNRLVLHMGQFVPVGIARELDVKLDDGAPRTGSLRNAASGPGVWQQDSGAVACVADNSGDPIWDIGNDSQNCNPTYLF